MTKKNDFEYVGRGGMFLKFCGIFFTTEEVHCSSVHRTCSSEASVAEAAADPDSNDPTNANLGPNGK